MQLNRVISKNVSPNGPHGVKQSVKDTKLMQRGNNVAGERRYLKGNVPDRIDAEENPSKFRNVTVMIV